MFEESNHDDQNEESIMEHIHFDPYIAEIKAQNDKKLKKTNTIKYLMREIL